jgi:hypothetical protein
MTSLDELANCHSVNPPRTNKQTSSSHVPVPHQDNKTKPQYASKITSSFHSTASLNNYTYPFSIHRHHYLLLRTFFDITTISFDSPRPQSPCDQTSFMPLRYDSPAQPQQVDSLAKLPWGVLLPFLRYPYTKFSTSFRLFLHSFAYSFILSHTVMST